MSILGWLCSFTENGFTGFFLDKPALGKLLGAAKAKVGNLGSKLLPMYLFQLISVYFIVECFKAYNINFLIQNLTVIEMSSIFLRQLQIHLL